MNIITKHNEKIRNYNGQNDFIFKMKEVVYKYGGLTEKQSLSVESVFNGKTNVNIHSLPDNLKSIMDYSGDNIFVLDVKDKFFKYGTLTDAQVSAANNQIKREYESKQRIDVNIDVIGETIIIGRNTGEKLKNEKGLNFNPVLLDITEVMTLTVKAIKFKGKLTTKNSNICKSCARVLTDNFSRLTGYGKTCSKHLGVKYIKDESEVERFNQEVLQKIEEIGEMEFWVPRRQIKLWNGESSILMKM